VFRSLLLCWYRSLQVHLIVAQAQRGCKARKSETFQHLELSLESSCLGMQLKMGGKLHLRLNTATSPIADKYREGKLKRTLKREFKST
jgi:hypothetical protein